MAAWLYKKAVWVAGCAGVVIGVAAALAATGPSDADPSLTPHRPEARATAAAETLTESVKRPPDTDSEGDAAVTPAPRPTALTAAQEAAIDAELQRAIATRLADDEARAGLLRELYGEVGVGRFVRGGRLTALGADVLERVRSVEDHALSFSDYPLAALEGALGALASEDPLAPGETPLPAVADVVPDLILGEALLQLALDFHFIRRAGPQDLRIAKTVMARKRSSKRLRAMLVAIAKDDSAAALDPVHPHYEPLLRAYAKYRPLAAKGPCPIIPERWRIAPGATGDRVKAVQRRLACEAYYDGEIDGVFEGASLAAAKMFQREHELNAEGYVYKKTIEALNIPIATRVPQLALALQRLRESKVDELSDFYIRVNIPAFELQVIDHGEVIRRHKTIVGTNRLDDDKKALVQGHLNRTKLFNTRLYQIVVHPQWFLPARVVNGELKGKVAEDPTWLERHNIKKTKLASGAEVYVQGFGPGNVLGEVKFLLEESNAIYLHDTDKRDLFNEPRRDFSHGCVRVEGAVGFAHWILRRDGFEQREIDKAFKLTDYQRGFTLKEPIDLITEYVTVDIGDHGGPVFLTDIYRYDRAFHEQTLPPQEVALWGSSVLRPNWVPRVSEETVEGWRARGMAAPRKYDPKVHGP